MEGNYLGTFNQCFCVDILIIINIPNPLKIFSNDEILININPTVLNEDLDDNQLPDDQIAIADYLRLISRFIAVVKDLYCFLQYFVSFTRHILRVIHHIKQNKLIAHLKKGSFIDVKAFLGPKSGGIILFAPKKPPTFGYLCWQELLKLGLLILQSHYLTFFH